MAIRRQTGSWSEYPVPEEAFETEYEGAVLYTYERNWHDDSDFNAVVWDAEAGTTRTIQYGTTRFGGSDYNTATPDATEEVKAAVADWAAEKERERLTGMWEADARLIRKGSAVTFKRAFSGRKQGAAAEGTEGEVIWTGPCKFNRYDTRAGVKIPGRNDPLWVSTDYLEVTDPEPVNEELIEAAVERYRAAVRETGRPRHESPAGIINAMNGGGIILALTGGS
jgi:hypothetical protein